ncbi:hypothetical protein AB0G67_46235 [Streptomyces sp. NPDC021056]|uniref:hypothetical protein n=1 Tax=Streptomyces sp. NPDC021056 TaxID=3155012 RepID=UPI0034063B1C
MTGTHQDRAGGRDPGIVAVLGAFVLNGALLGSWAPRVPALAAQIGAQEGALGLSLLGASRGMIAASLLAGRLCAAFGARVVMTVSGVAGSATLPTLGLAKSPTALGPLLIVLGAMVGVTAIRRTGRLALKAYRSRRNQRRTRRTSTGTEMANPINAVQNFNTMVICGSQPQTTTTAAAVTIVTNIGDLQGAANSDAVDGAATTILSRPDLDSRQQLLSGSLADPA